MAAAAMLTLLILLLGFARIFEMQDPADSRALGSIELLARYTSPFQIVNSYGLFAVMTTGEAGDSRRGIRMTASSGVAYEFRSLQAGGYESGTEVGRAVSAKQGSIGRCGSRR